jgi:hypothetical protein
MNAGWIMPLALVLGTTYLVYFGVRAVVLAMQDSGTSSPSAPPNPARPDPSFAAAQPAVHPVAMQQPQPAAAGQRAAPMPVKKRRKLQEVAREQLARKSLGERLTELTGSMLMSALVVGVVSFLALIVTETPINDSVQTWTSFTWLSIVSLLGTWLLLIPAKLWEGSEGDQVRRRFVNLLLGLALGVIGYGLSGYLGVRLATQEWIDLPLAWRPPTGAFSAGGVPELPAYLAFFGGIFLLLRWWGQADPLRPGRFSLWATVVTLFVACVWQIFWPFPQPWSLSIPVTMSIALQLSSSWLSEKDRNQIRRSSEA